MRRLLLLASSALLAIAHAPAASAQEAPAEPPPIWEAQVGASFVGTGGNTETSTLGADFSMQRRWPEWKVESAANAVRTTDQGKRTAERYIGTFRGERKLTEIVGFSFGERAERDRLSGILFRSLLDAGLGWALVRGPAWTFDAVTGVAWKHERPLGRRLLNHTTGLVQALSRLRIGGSGDSTQRFTIYPDFHAPADYRSEAELALQAALNSRLALKLAYLWRYSNAPVPGFTKHDTTGTASIVLRWRREAGPIVDSR